MLDEQFFGNKKYHKFLKNNFVVIHPYENHPQAGEDLYAVLNAIYKTIGSPTVIIAMPDGSEIDRIFSYSPPADEYLKKVIDAYTSKDSYFNLKKAYKKNPDNFDTLIQLMNKLLWHNTSEFQLEILEKVISNPKAKTKIVTDRRGNKITAFEYAEPKIKGIKHFLDKVKTGEIK